MSALRSLGALLALITMAVSLATPAPAGAGQSCWQTVINDWADNERVDGRYAIHCYRDALKNLPEDMRAYSSAPDDIERAMREEMRRLQQEASEGDASGGPGTTTDGNPTTTAGSPAAPKPKKEPDEQEAPLPYLGDPDLGNQSAESDGVLVQALDEIGPHDANSFPLPLLVLGGLFCLLLIGGGVGYLARRQSPRR